MAPGIDFDAVPGLTDPNAMPHAWKAGSQTTPLLKQQLNAMPSNGVAVLTHPQGALPLPPWALRARLPAGRLVEEEQAHRQAASAGRQPRLRHRERQLLARPSSACMASVIEYRTSTEVLSADAATMTLQTTTGAVSGNVINLIPRQRCGPIVAATGLANATEGRFAGVNVLNYESTVSPGVHIIGDSSATTQPKAGHIANQEAKVCADAIVRAFAGEQPDPAPVTSSACYSTITMRQASWLEAVFQYDPVTRVMTPVANATGASIGWSGDNFEQMNTWFNALMADSFA
ncbi:MAG: hypothetical protein U5L74_00340 [Ideonella sp.]|nr:hypothetical protein [Ideonella sp.]